MSHRFTVSRHHLGESGGTDQGRGHHLDWFFAVNPNPDKPLLTWSTPIHWSPESDLAVWRLPDHRARYLDYDGDLSGDRGQVQRLVSGTYQLVALDAKRMEFRVESVALVDAMAGSPSDRALGRLAAGLCNQLAASEYATIRFFSQEPHRDR